MEAHDEKSLDPETEPHSLSRVYYKYPNICYYSPQDTPFLDNSRDSDKDTENVNDKKSRSRKATYESREAKNSQTSDTILSRAIISLNKTDESNFGITITAYKHKKVKIVAVQLGSSAHRSDALEKGDLIVSVNGQKLTKAAPYHVEGLLGTSKNHVQLEIEYPLPKLNFRKNVSDRYGTCFVKQFKVKLRKDDINSNYGFVVRGGRQPVYTNSIPFIVTSIRPGGSADRDGSIKPGDRLLFIDNLNLENTTLTEMISLIKHYNQDAIFTFAYDTLFYDKITNNKSIILEIEKPIGVALGIILFSNSNKRRVKQHLRIRKIKPASIADRCGVLCINDIILSIDDMNTAGMSTLEAQRLLKYNMNKNRQTMKLIIYKNVTNHLGDSNNTAKFSCHSIKCNGNGRRHIEDMRADDGEDKNAVIERRSSNSSQTSLSSFEESECNDFHHKNLRHTKKGCHDDTLLNYESQSSTLSSDKFFNNHISHIENIEIIIKFDSHGLGIALQNKMYNDITGNYFTFISNIDPLSVSERSGVLQVGDKIIEVNRRKIDNVPAQKVAEWITNSSKVYDNSHMKLCRLKIEFKVLESITLTSGVFVVQIAKRLNSDIGLKLMSPFSRKFGEPLVISEVKRASPAYRSGVIKVGDKCLEINGNDVTNHTLKDATELLNTQDSLTRLKIVKSQALVESEDLDDEFVMYDERDLIYKNKIENSLYSTNDIFNNSVSIDTTKSNGIIKRPNVSKENDNILSLFDGKGNQSKHSSIDDNKNNEKMFYRKISENLSSIDRNFLDFTNVKDGQGIKIWPSSNKVMYKTLTNRNDELGSQANYKWFNFAYNGSNVTNENPIRVQEKRNGIIWVDENETTGDAQNTIAFRGSLDNNHECACQKKTTENDNINVNPIFSCNKMMYKKPGSAEYKLIPLLSLTQLSNTNEESNNTPVQSIDSAVESLDSSGGDTQSPLIEGNTQHENYLRYPVLIINENSKDTFYQGFYKSNNYWFHHPPNCVNRNNNELTTGDGNVYDNKIGKCSKCGDIKHIAISSCFVDKCDREAQKSIVDSNLLIYRNQPTSESGHNTSLIDQSSKTCQNGKEKIMMKICTLNQLNYKDSPSLLSNKKTFISVVDQHIPKLIKPPQKMDMTKNLLKYRQDLRSQLSQPNNFSLPVSLENPYKANDWDTIFDNEKLSENDLIKQIEKTIMGISLLTRPTNHYDLTSNPKNLSIKIRNINDSKKISNLSMNSPKVGDKCFNDHNAIMDVKDLTNVPITMSNDHLINNKFKNANDRNDLFISLNCNQISNSKLKHLDILNPSSRKNVTQTLYNTKLDKVNNATEFLPTDSEENQTSTSTLNTVIYCGGGKDKNDSASQRFDDKTLFKPNHNYILNNVLVTNTI
ncbi:uncharacterized protein LOC135922633 isoform X2 [Gordionus sp. m RMFG-2023]|uniref:uncharacterized protein LOC135922633 isoform X2 n=1 Tax=Gordionus sp. m RMFG-2023 TaxID=3053472 RepID=UPI0031FD6FFF